MIQSCGPDFCFSQRAGCAPLEFGCYGRRVAERLRCHVYPAKYIKAAAWLCRHDYSRDCVSCGGDMSVEQVLY